MTQIIDIFAKECGWLYIFQKLQLITELWSTSCEPFDIITGSFMVKAHLSACGEFVTIMSLMENQCWRARWTIVLQNIKFHDFTVLFSLYFWIKFSLYTGCFFTGQPKKLTKCQPRRKFWHLNFFYRIYYVIWQLVIFRKD